MRRAETKQTDYFARTLHGLEELSWRDIAARNQSKLTAFSHRTIQFASSVEPSDLLQVRGVEDIFVQCGKISGLARERASLKVLEASVRKLPLPGALQVCRTVREIPRRPRYSVTASFVGTRNYNRWELAEAVAAGVSKAQDWEFVDTRDTPAPAHEVNVRLIIEGDEGLLGLRLGSAPLHKRPYKQLHLEASLNPVLAYHLVKLAGLRDGETLLDPMCGAGTIPIEAACAEPDAIVLATDIRTDAVQATKENASLARASVATQRCNALQSTLEAASIDAIVSDFPWGGQTQLEGGSLSDLCVELVRLLKPSGRLVVLTEQPDDLRAPLEAHGFTVSCPYTVSLHGKHPAIILAHRKA